MRFLRRTRRNTPAKTPDAMCIAVYSPAPEKRIKGMFLAIGIPNRTDSFKKNVKSNNFLKLNASVFYLTYPFIYVILIVRYVRNLKKIQKTEQPTDTIDNQNCKRYTSLGIFFSQPEISEKIPLNPHSDWVYNRNIKNTKKQKKIPFGIFSVRLVSFLAQNHIRIFRQKTSRVIPKISASDNGKKPNISRDMLLYRL